MSIFTSGEILLPQNVELNKWSVIAVDQFTSNMEYWQRVEKFVGVANSSLNLVLPEIFLDEDCGERIAKINAVMRQYLQQQTFRSYQDAYIYVERTLQNGLIRRGLLGVVDLENFDYQKSSQSLIRPTEETVLSRIPPRQAIRRDALLELPHILLLGNDVENVIFGTIEKLKAKLPLLYDFELMEKGGQLRGYLIQGEARQTVAQAIAKYEANKQLCYAVGDGNHSLSAAKACYEEEKAKGGKNLLSRYALVELGNIQDESQRFEPIHRLLKKVNVKEVLAYLNSDEGCSLQYITAGGTGKIKIGCRQGELPVGALQRQLDKYLSEHAGSLDYIHGEDELEHLAKEENNIGFVLPTIDKNAFFESIAQNGVLPRKTFSMGHAEEKRYYLEARKIK